MKYLILLVAATLICTTAGFCQEKAAATTPATGTSVAVGTTTTTTTTTAASSSAKKKVWFSFEESVPSWEIPDWAKEKDEYVAESIAMSNKFAKDGKASLEVMTNFPGAKWTAAYVEIAQYFDWTPYKTLSADIYLPKEAPFGLQGRFILTVGENWTWTEMSRLVKLVPGEWTTVSASLIPGSIDWRRTQVTDEFRADVRKLGIRVESNMRPVYNGAVYIDNVTLE